MKHLTTILILLLFGYISCKTETKKSTYTKLQGQIFGTTYNISYKDHKKYNQEIDSIFDTINKSLSTYLATSDISRINQNDSTVIVDDLFIEVFEKAKRIHQETNGYFDPTLGQLINAYGFGSKEGFKNLSKEELAHLKKLVGFDNVTLNDRKISKKIPEIQFDVNALAKGYGLDVIGRFLESKHIKNYLIEIGGEIRVRGMKNGKPWKVALEKPNVDGTQSFQKIIELTDKSMATSGNYRKFRIGKEGKKFVHIVNAKTGLAQESNLLSASVIANGDCADVDAYATAFMAMGLEKTKNFIQKHQNLKVILMYLDENGKIVVFEN